MVYLCLPRPSTCCRSGRLFDVAQLAYLWSFKWLSCGRPDGILRWSRWPTCCCLSDLPLFVRMAYLCSLRLHSCGRSSGLLVVVQVAYLWSYRWRTCFQATYFWSFRWPAYDRPGYQVGIAQLAYWWSFSRPTCHRWGRLLLIVHLSYLWLFRRASVRPQVGHLKDYKEVIWATTSSSCERTQVGHLNDQM